MDFGANKTPVEVIRQGAFGGTYFREIYSSVTEKWSKKSWKEFDQLKDTDQKYYCSDYYDVIVNKYGVKCGTSLRFWEMKVGLIKQILMVGFSGILDDKRQINRWKNIVNRFRSKLIKMNKDVNSKFDDDSISP